jgi:ATP-binding cassette subfamily C protein
MEAVECGAACLGSVLGYHGRHVPLSELREACGVSRDGSNAANVVQAARRYGLKAKGLSTDLQDVRSLPPPFIVFWNFNHFIVVEGFQEDRVRVNDPALGRHAIALAEFDRGFTGVVLHMEPGPEFRASGAPPSTLRALRARLTGEAPDLARCIAAGFLLVAPGVTLPLLTRLFVDDVLIHGRQEWVRPLLLAMVVMGLLQVVLGALQLTYLRALRARLAVRLTSAFVGQVLRLPVGFFAQRFAGEISSRVALNQGVAEMLSGRLAAAAIDVAMLVFYAGVMLVCDVPLTLIALLLSLFNVAALHALARRRVESSLKLRHDVGRVAGVAIGGLQGIETLKASALESGFFARWAGHYAQAAGARQELGLATGRLGVVPGLLAALGTAVVLVAGGLRVMGGQMSLGMLVAFQGLLLMFQRPVATLVGLGGQLQTLQGDLNRLDDVLVYPADPETQEPAVPTEAQAPQRLTGRLELRDVTFGYSRVSPPLIERFSLLVEPGQRVALLGGSGSGKSTVARLACGLYQPWEGQVLVDGRRRAEIPRATLAASIALVDQDIVIFGGTVRQNLTLWDETVPQAWLDQACRDAEIEELIRSLPGGYGAELLEGAANLSGGQRQRLELARALVGSPALLVLDEATSALDADTEQRVDANLRRRGCAMLIVAHRLSTVRDADEIIVLDRGRVAERGRHADLWNRAGEYRRLLEYGEGAS